MSIEEMKAELEKTWYTAFAVIDPEYPAVYIPCVHTPDGLEICRKTPGFTDHDACKDEAIKIAYALLQKERELESLRSENTQFAEFAKQVAGAKVPSEWYTPAPYKYAFHRLKNNARALMVNLGKSGQETKP